MKGSSSQKAWKRRPGKLERLQWNAIKMIRPKPYGSGGKTEGTGYFVLGKRRLRDALAAESTA